MRRWHLLEKPSQHTRIKANPLDLCFWRTRSIKSRHHMWSMKAYMVVRRRNRFLAGLNNECCFKDNNSCFSSSESGIPWLLKNELWPWREPGKVTSLYFSLKLRSTSITDGTNYTMLWIINELNLRWSQNDFRSNRANFKTWGKELRIQAWWWSTKNLWTTSTANRRW